MSSEGAVSVIQVVGLFVAGPLLVGWMRKVRCLMEGRVGPPVHQVLRDTVKQIRKERTRPEQASWVFAAAPVVLIASTAAVAWLIPLVSTRTSWGASADLFAVVYLMLVGSVAMALGALDSGTAFGGMGASRAVMIGALAEPALLVAILALAIPVHSSNLPVVISGGISHPLWLASPQRILAFGAFLIVVLAETGRLPVDNPTTHLELTMIHEAMVLEYAGGDIALVTVGEAARLALLLGLMANLFLPWGIATHLSMGSIAVGLAVLIVKVAGFGTLVAAGEVFIAKVRLFRVPELMAGAFVLSVLAVVAAVVGA